MTRPPQEKIETTIKRLTEARSWRDGCTLQEQDLILAALEAYKPHLNYLEDVEPLLGDYMEVIKAVSHVGIDFGYGKYELQPEMIDLARKPYEQSEEDDRKIQKIVNGGGE